MFHIGPPLWSRNQDPPHHEGHHPREEHEPMDPEQFAHLLDNAMGSPARHAPSRSRLPVRTALPPDPWEEAAKRYNVRAMPPRALADLSLELYEAGAITTVDHLILSASPDDAQLPWGSPLLTAQENAEHIDWIEEFKARRLQAWSFRHTRSVEELDRLLAHLTRIDALARGWHTHAV